MTERMDRSAVVPCRPQQDPRRLRPCGLCGAAPHSMAGIESYLRLLAQGRLPQPVDGIVLQGHIVG